MIRSCPICASQISYLTNRGFVIACQRNSKCRKCTDTANVGYRHSVITRDKISRNNSRYWSGKKRDSKTTEKLRGNRKGKASWNSGLRGVYSPETLNKMRRARIANMVAKHHQVRPNFNSFACLVIDHYGRQNGYSFRHALNGGEFHIKELGYWVDGYDESTNTVIKYHERRHHSRKAVKNKDERRKAEIIAFLGCRFIILEEQYDD